VIMVSDTVGESTFALFRSAALVSIGATDISHQFSVGTNGEHTSGLVP